MTASHSPAKDPTTGRDGVDVSVIDDGPGIPPERLDMLFQKFGELEGCVIQFGSFYLDQLDGQKTPLRVYLSLPRVSPTRQQTSRGYSPCLIIQPSRKNLFVLGQIDKYLLPNLQFTLLASHPYTQRQLQAIKKL